MLFRSLSVVILILSITACQKASPDIPLAAQDFLPAIEQLREGVLHEYVTRYDQGPNKDIQGALEYSLYRMSSDGSEVSIQGLTPALRPMSLTTLLVSDSMLNINRSERYFRLDTFGHEVNQSELLRYDGKASTLELASDQWTRTRHLRQVADTTWRGMAASRFVGTEYSHVSASGQRDTAQLEKLYVKGLGVVYSKNSRPSSSFTRELVRQLSPKQHADLLATVPKRVAYIDPENILIPDTQDWAPCRDDFFIADYYNPTPDIGYPGGQYALKRDLLPQIDLSALANESGYLTIRFVVNCEGVVGRFTSDEADLDFKPKQFPRESVKEVALAIQTLTGWNTGKVFPKEPLADFYTYITLKFEDGKLIDLLP